MSASTVHDHEAGPLWTGYARTTLGERGVRAGGARSAVIDLLGSQSCCLSAQEIREKLRRRANTPSLASVYRAVELLHELGLVQRLEVGGGVARYEPALPGGDHHHHVVCDRCGRIAPFSDDGLEEAITALAARLRHRVSAHEVVLRGACPRCAPRRAKA